MIDYNYIELKNLATTDLKLFERKRQEMITSFFNTTENVPHIRRLERIQKNINNQVAFHEIKDNPQHFERKRKEIIVSFLDSFSSGSNKDILLGLQEAIEKKYEYLGMCMK